MPIGGNRGLHVEKYPLRKVMRMGKECDKKETLQCLEHLQVIIAAKDIKISFFAHIFIDCLKILNDKSLIIKSTELANVF